MRKVDLPGSDMRQPRNDKGDARDSKTAKTSDLRLATRHLRENRYGGRDLYRRAKIAP